MIEKTYGGENQRPRIFATVPTYILFLYVSAFVQRSISTIRIFYHTCVKLIILDKKVGYFVTSPIFPSCLLERLKPAIKCIYYGAYHLKTSKKKYWYQDKKSRNNWIIFNVKAISRPPLISNKQVLGMAKDMKVTLAVRHHFFVTLLVTFYKDDMTLCYSRSSKYTLYTYLNTR